MMKFFLKVKIHPLTYLIIFSSLITGLFKYFLMILGIVLFHELGHIVAALIFKRKITQISILPFGGLTKIDSIISSVIEEDLLISISGIFFQILLGMVVFFLYRWGLFEEKFYNLFYYYNSSVIVLNLLPINPLDGYKIFKLFCEKCMPFKYTFWVGLFVSLVFVFFLIIIKPDFIFDNIFVFFFLIFISFKEVFVIKYILNRFYLERMNRKFKFKTKKIYSISQMYKNKNNIINEVEESDFLKGYLYSSIK